MKEQFQGIIDMGHVPRGQVERLVAFFYHTDYEKASTEGTSESPFQLHARMFALADQYDIPELLLRAAERYRETCVNSWDSLDFLSSISTVYESTPASVVELRQTACVAIRKHLPGMLEDAVTAECFGKIISENSTFAKDLLESYIKNPLFGYCRTCRTDHGMEPLQTRCHSCNKGQGGLSNHWGSAW